MALANGLGFVAETSEEEGGILETRVSGREKVLEDGCETCGRLSEFIGAEVGTCEMSVLEPERERGRRVKPDED